MKNNNKFFIAMLSIVIGTEFAVFNNADAASVRTPVRVSTATSRRPAATNTKVVTPTPVTPETLTTTPAPETVSQSTEEQPTEVIIENKSSNFEVSVSAPIESSVFDNSFAEMIRKQRAAFEANETTTAATNAQQTALKTSSNTCDRDLRKCMATKCGNDFTKCALDGDTMFGDKLNACRRDTECTGEEFQLFTTEIKADRDMNVRLASYNKVIDCGNQYNACLVNECGKTYNKCLGKPKEDAAVQKCASIAKECVEADSGLTNRFGTAIGKLRESAEKEVKKDDERMYAMRDSMQSVCKRMGAMFDERTFDCIFTVNFFAGNDQKNPMASRKRYAGDTFVCMQEWFGVDTTTYKENAYRETRAQTGASSAMLGSGVGTAVGLVSSGAIDRALDTQKAKKALNAEKKAQKANANSDEQGSKKEVKEDNRTIDDVVDKHNKNTKEIMDKVDETAKNHGIETQKEKDDPLYQSNKFIDKLNGDSGFRRQMNDTKNLKMDTPKMEASKGMGDALSNTSASSFFSATPTSGTSSSSSGGSSGSEATK